MDKVYIIGKVCILSVGINKYVHFPQYNLRFCASDAKIVYDKYSQYSCEYKELLLDEEATRSNILNKLEDIKNVSRNEDYVIFNFAGHGFTIAKSEEEIDSTNTFICTHDFENGRIHTTIRLHELNEAINSIKAKSKFVIFDACHSGGALRRDFSLLNLREIKVNKLIELFAENKGTCIITACNSNEEAVEKSELEHGIFTYNLIECLEKAYTSNDFPMVPYSELYDMVLEAVKQSTEDAQHPQIKCSDEDFKVLALPPSSHETKKEIKLDTIIIPTAEIPKASEYYTSKDLEKFERTIIQLIQEDRFIEIDKLVKDQISEIFTKLSKPEISLNAASKDAIPYYESCREYLKPLLLLTRYILEYYDPKYITNNLEYIFHFEELTRNKIGTVAIIEIPITVISEIILNLMNLAYNTRNYVILKKLLLTSINFNGTNSKIIYDYRVWHPELFRSNVTDYVKYIFPKSNDEDLFSTFSFRSFEEVNFLFDCYSTNFEYPNVCYPAFLVYGEFDTPEKMVSKLVSEVEDQDLIDCVKEVFSIDDINDFLKLVVKRLNEISSWESSKFHGNDFYLNPIIKKIEEHLGIFSS